jgi:hypothetical protein
MSYQTIEFHVRGVAPLLMHNGQLANPLNKWSKAMKTITSNRKKTDEDYAQLANLEFLGSLYVNEEGRAVLPGEVIEGTIVSGAKRTKQGKDAKSAIIVDGNFPLLYDGPKTPETLRDDERFRYVAGVAVGQSRVMRTRPIFKTWECKFAVSFLDDMLNAQEVIDFVETAGRVAGFGDGRPRFGRFEILSHSAA